MTTYIFDRFDYVDNDTIIQQNTIKFIMDLLIEV